MCHQVHYAGRNVPRVAIGDPSVYRLRLLLLLLLILLLLLLVVLVIRIESWVGLSF